MKFFSKRVRVQVAAQLLETSTHTLCKYQIPNSGLTTEHRQLQGASQYPALLLIKYYGD